MRRAFSLVAALLAVGMAIATADAGSAPGTLRAGVGTADITPPVGTPMFAYTAREAVAGGVAPFLSQESFDTNLYAKTFLATVGVHTRLRARALVIEDGGRRVALVAVDLGGLPYDLHQAVAQRIAAAGAGIDPTDLLLSATHTHAGAGPIWPLTHSAYGILGGDVFDPRVFGAVADGIAAAIVDAAATLEPARVGVGSVEVLDATNNRNLEPHLLDGDEPHTARGDDKPHSIDGTLTVVRADTATGRPLGLWSAFAIHGTAFGDDMLHFSGDNQAYAERLVENEIRRRAGLGADTVVVHALANGAEGDISPRTGPPAVGEVPLALPPEGASEPAAYVVGDHAGAEAAGQRVARGALAAWELAGEAMVDSIALDTRWTLLPLNGTSLVNGEPVGLTVALGCGGVVCPDGTELPVDVPGQGAKLPLALAPPGVLVPAFAPLQVLRLGDLLLAAAPFEVTKQMGERIERAVTSAAASGGLVPQRVALVGLANGYASYMATPEEYDASFYEGSFTLYGRQQGPAIQAGLASLAGALAGGMPAPAGAAALPFVDPSVPDLPPLLPEPDVGTVLDEPSDATRFDQVEFRWIGGDPAADDPHIRVERRTTSGAWEVATTDDGFEDVVTHRRPIGSLPHEWSELWETNACTAPGTYRFVVAGSSGAGPYTLVSREFDVAPAPAPTPEPVTVAGGVASFRATYPEPVDGTIRLRPRFAAGGGAELVVVAADGSQQRVAAPWSPSAARYEATGAFGPGATATVVDGTMVDGCGNGAAAAVPPPFDATPPVPSPQDLPATGGGTLPLLAVLALAAVVAARRAGARSVRSSGSVRASR